MLAYEALITRFCLGLVLLLTLAMVGSALVEVGGSHTVYLGASPSQKVVPISYTGDAFSTALRSAILRVDDSAARAATAVTR